MSRAPSDPCRGPGRYRWPLVALAALALVSAEPEPRSDTERYKEHYDAKDLYTASNPSLGGGIHGRALNAAGSLRAAFAVPPSDPKRVYRAGIVEDNSFYFSGLPVSRYDLFLLFDNAVYEGFTLTRGEDTLTAQDRKAIQSIVEQSEPFFNSKTLHRAAGKTGRMTGEARAVCTFLRTKPSLDYAAETYTDHRRAFKLVLFEDVGPGWQIVRTRELYSGFVKPSSIAVVFKRDERLSGIRVTDKVKDLGDIDLSAAPQ